MSGEGQSAWRDAALWGFGARFPLPAVHRAMQSIRELVYNDELTALQWALNSAVECHLHTVEVIGSNPIAPTIRPSCLAWGFLAAISLLLLPCATLLGCGL